MVVGSSAPPPPEVSSLIQNSVQMVAVFLERIGHEAELEGYKNDLERLVEAKTHDLVLREIKYRTLFESMIQGVVYQNSEGIVTSANPAAERILGLTLEQMQGRTSADPRWHSIREDGSSFPGDEHPSMVALKTGKEVMHVIMGVSNPVSDNYTWINIHAVPRFRLGEEKPYEVFTTFEDITSQKLYFEQLKKSEALYHDLVETSQELIWQCDADGKYTFVNSACEEILGYTPEEMIGRKFTDFQSAEYAENDMKEFKRLLHGNIVKGLETVHLAKDGSPVNLIFNAKYIRDPGGTILGTRGVAYDVTEKKKRSDEFATLSNRQESILAAIPDIIMEVDSEKTYTWANKAGLDFFGSDVIGKTADYFFEGDQNTFRSVQPLFEGHEDVIYVESWQRRRDREKRLLAWWCRVLKDADGKVTGALSTARDITETRRIETNLEELVVERTAELESVNKELEAFAYSISHDLRAPLRAIEGYSSILQERYSQKLDEEGRRFLDVIRKSTIKLDTLITDLLDLSRIGRKELNVSMIQMNKLVESVLLEIISPEENEQVELDIAPLPDCSADPILIRQVFVNILLNAFKYTGKQKQRSIIIGARKERDNRITYWVKDNGVGFDNKYAEKIFGVFQRLHTDGEFEGTGVGLAIVDRIIKRHGGTVWADGILGEGATFYITLPGTV